MAEPNDELEVLRRTVAELKDKSSTRKKRITEIEMQLAETQTLLTTANGAIYELRVGAPLKAMAEELGSDPELWLEQFSKLYKVETVDGKLAVLNASDGKPATKDGKTVAFERQSLLEFLTDEKHPKSKTFRAITVASRASGGNDNGTRRPQAPATPKPLTRRFGLS